MFDIGWSEFVVIAVVALIAIGPKELPGVLRMVGQWIGKARRMAAEFQGQFQEAMREAEMADLKQSFDEVKQAAAGFTGGNLMTPLEKDVNKSLDIEGIERPAPPLPDLSSTEAAMADAAPTDPPSVAPITEVATAETPMPDTFAEGGAHKPADQPLEITPRVHADPAVDAAEPTEPLRDAKAS
jgi:sec-independent protein translocase protein TatB